jgi:ubiquinone/menaquinone biosynthesis C-methylase UbiE
MKFINPFNQCEATLDKNSLTDTENNSFPRKNGVYRVLANAENYTNSFGFQWNKFQQTQIDRELSNLGLSKERFFLETNWVPDALAGENILEVGSGAGRFSQVVLENTKANLFSIDFSNAVEANWRNNGQQGDDRFKLFQASVYNMPFADNQFDKVFCLGVLQHTPDFEKSVKSLIDKCKPGGEVVVDFYQVRGFWTKIHSKYLLRPFTKKLNHEKLLSMIDENVDWLISSATFLNKIGLQHLTRFLPLVDLRPIPKNLNPQQFRDWVVLDTFDMFSPQYDNPQTINTVKNWFEKYGMTVSFAGIVSGTDNFMQAPVVRGIKK